MEIKRETACAQQAEDCGNHELAKAYREGLKGKKKRLKELDGVRRGGCEGS